MTLEDLSIIVKKPLLEWFSEPEVHCVDCGSKNLPKRRIIFRNEIALDCICGATFTIGVS